MAVSAILNFGQFSAFDLDDMEGRVILIFKGLPRSGSPFLELCFWIQGQSQGHIRDKRSNMT